jgi:NitT/TauT family transport system ATP-binding protein
VVFVTHDIEEAVFLSDRILVMSAKPGRITLDLEVNLPERPRVEAIRSAPEFQQYVALIRAELQQQRTGDR